MPSAATPSGAAATAEQLLAGVIERFRLHINAADDTAAGKGKKLEHLQALQQRASAQLDRLSSNLETLYGGRQDVPAVTEKMLELVIAKGLERPDDLRQLDAAREHDPNWFSSNKSIGSAMYVDRYCGTLSNLKGEIDYLKFMNVSMLHLLPTIYKTPATNNDGGYAISDFRSLNPAIGTMDELRELFGAMRKNGISPVMDVTVNHVADEHAWAMAAKAGDPEKLGYFYAMGEAEKNEYDKHVSEVFPEIRRGSFTWNDDTHHFMWTTFMSSQWDLNYSNPKTLLAMAGELMFLLNQGAEALRLDAVPWLWKEKGTSCIERPEVQTLLGVFNAVSRIAAPGAVLLSEQISEPESLKRNLGTDRCQMAYSTIPLVHMWDALAHEDASFMAEVLRQHANTPKGTALLNMVRTHDEVGFHFDPVSAEKLGIDLSQRWQQLRDFYLGDHGYARALPFQENGCSNKLILTGTTGSLAGVEKAVEAGDPQQADAAIQRIKLLNSVVLSLPGVPMLNLMGGDDRGQVNDYSFREDPIRGKDNRWANRVERNVDFGKKTPLEVEVMSRVFNDTVELNRVRAEEMPAFDAGPMQVIDTGKRPVLAFARKKAQQTVVVLANFSHSVQKVNAESLRAHGMTEAVIDKIGQQKDQVQKIGTGIELAPYQCMWLVPAGGHTEQPLSGRTGMP